MKNPCRVWALQEDSGAGHSGDTLGLGTPGTGHSRETLGLGGHSRVGHCRDTLGLGNPGMSCRPGEETSSGRGEELSLQSNNPTQRVGEKKPQKKKQKNKKNERNKRNKKEKQLFASQAQQQLHSGLPRSRGRIGRLDLASRLGLLKCEGLGFRVQGSGFRVQGSGFRVQGSGFRVQGSGFRV